MKSIMLRITLFAALLFSIIVSSAHSATERRTALVIGNSAYTSGPLKNPVNDAAALAAQLQKLGFTVIMKKNVNLRGMEEALTEFGNRLKRGGVGLFFYAGHALQVGGVNYLVPVSAKVNRESDIKYETLDAGKVLDEMANANNGLNIVILDACRDNPYSRSFRSASRGLAIVSNAPMGTFISYSTSPGNVARDGAGKYSPYTEALLRYMKEPGLTIEQVFKNVRAKLGKETGGKQVPWELSSLQGEFFFAPSLKGHAAEPSPAARRPEKQKSADNETDELEIVMAKVRQQQEDKAAKRAELEEKFRSLLSDVKKYKTIIIADIDAETKVLAWGALVRKYPSLATGIATGQADEIVLKAITADTDGSLKKLASEAGFPTVKEVTNDGRFIAYDNGTVFDTRTNLMWAAKDNGRNINWANAKSYCENYKGGGYTDWRMPTQDELAKLYDANKTRPVACDDKYYLEVATALIDITCFAAWTSETSGSEAALFYFSSGVRSRGNRSFDYGNRALPVRSAK